MVDEVTAEVTAETPVKSKKPRAMKTVTAEDSAEAVAVVEGAEPSQPPAESVKVTIVEAAEEDAYANLPAATRAEMEAGRAALARPK